MKNIKTYWFLWHYYTSVTLTYSRNINNDEYTSPYILLSEYNPLICEFISEQSKKIHNPNLDYYKIIRYE